MINDFEFVKIKDGYSIIKYNGNQDVVIIPDKFNNEPIIKINSNTFYECTNIKEVIFPDTITYIGKFAFYLCKNLTSIKLPENLQFLREYAFCGCSELIEITFPKSLQSFPSDTFINCSNVKTIISSNENLKIPHSEFLHFHDITEISFCLWKSLPFYLQHKLSIIKLSNWDNIDLNERKEILTFIKRRKNLRNSIFFTNNLTIISILLNENINITLDDLEKYIEHSIKQENTSITAVYLDYKEHHYTKETIKNYEENKELVEIGLELPTIKQLKQKWHINYFEGSIRITGYKGSNTTETIPNSTIDGKKIIALYYVEGLNFEPIENLIIDAQINEIPEKIFHNCNSLKYITLPNTIKKIGYYSFASCVNLQEIDFPPSLEFIDEFSFPGCKSIKKIIFPKSLVILGNHSFIECNNLKYVEFNSNVDVGFGVFNYDDDLVIVEN